MIILLAWVAFAALIGYAAGERGRSAIGFFLLALVLSPIVAAIVLVLLPVRVRTVAQVHQDGEPWTDQSQAPWGYACGRCGKSVSPAWRGQCKHCHVHYADIAPINRFQEAQA